MVNSFVFCEVCDVSIDGPVFWTTETEAQPSMAVCKRCFRVFERQATKKMLSMPHIDGYGLLAVFGITTALTIGIDSWPLVDNLAFLAALGSGGLLLIKLAGKAYR